MNTPNPFSRRRLIENEKLIRANNEAAKDAIAKYFAADKEVLHDRVAFYCECSREHCKDQIPMSIAEYEAEHRRRDRFTIMEGHQTPDVEKVVERKRHYVVVEKFALSVR